jgi:hypothetical protein
MLRATTEADTAVYLERSSPVPQQVYDPPPGTPDFRSPAAAAPTNTAEYGGLPVEPFYSVPHGLSGGGSPNGGPVDRVLPDGHSGRRAVAMSTGSGPAGTRRNWLHAARLKLSPNEVSGDACGRSVRVAGARNHRFRAPGRTGFNSAVFVGARSWAARCCRTASGR